ncbi:MAG: Flp pilus assembly complex ATPase component TadA [Candidatus Glassbacteria bacterium]|nr:Flp pilus assembly complex ATPase component TadA [Candidatus Glassbacteria bacterium]
MAIQSTQPLGELLVERGLLTKDQLSVALKEQGRTGKRMGEVLVSLGFCGEDDISRVVASQAGVKMMDLSQAKPDPAALELIDEEFAKHNKLVPVRLSGDNLVVAMDTTLDVMLIDKLQGKTGKFIEIVQATETDILQAIDRFYGGETSEDDAIEQLSLEAEQVERGGEQVGEEESPVVKLVDQLLLKGAKLGATDIHIEPDENTVRTRFRVDGILQQGPSLPKTLQSGLIARLKVMGNLNIAESRMPQDGRFRFYMGKRKIDLRLSTLPTVFGENVVMRLLDKSKVILGMDRLGFTPKNSELFKDLISRPNGIILVTGPTGSGKTTTLYAALSYINSSDRKIVTLEDPVEYEIPMIRQAQINVRAGFTYAAGMRSILRQDPDIILVGEIRDAETAEIAVQAALTGHLVFSTLHTNDSAGAFPRLIDMGIESFLVSSSVICVVAQRLIRKICPKCKTEYQPTDEDLHKLGLNDKGRKYKFYTGKGCDFCSGTGYQGRCAIYEILKVNQKIEKLILERADGPEIRQAAADGGMMTLLHDALIKAVNGQTSIQEVLRVTYAGN